MSETGKQAARDNFRRIFQDAIDGMTDEQRARISQIAAGIGGIWRISMDVAEGRKQVTIKVTSANEAWVTGEEIGRDRIQMIQASTIVKAKRCRWNLHFGEIEVDPTGTGNPVRG